MGESTFARHVDQLDVVATAEAAGVTRDDVLATIERLDAAVAGVDGHGFEVTPFAPHPGLAAAIGLPPDAELWVKDETGNVSGSHKGRHLFGVALGLALEGAAPDRLAIASCGNAALAATVVAAATEQRLEVYVPEWADEQIVAQMTAMGAEVVHTPRQPGVAGDPAYHAMVAAIRDGATAFSCQGTDTPTTVDGGRTIAYEMVEQLAGRPLDRLFLQVGGGALASAVVTGLGRMLDGDPPVIHAVQPDGNHPLVIAWDTVIGELGDVTPTTNAERSAAAAAIGALPADARRAVIARLQASTDQYMRPWPSEPASYATGILDDITYDWLAIVDALLATGGFPIVATDDDFRAAHRIAHEVTAIPVCPTGASGLGGLLAARRDGLLTLDGERVAVIFSGHQRPGDPAPV